MFRRQKHLALTTQDAFDSAKHRFETIKAKIHESSLPEEDKSEAQNLNEAQYRKAIEHLICTY